MYEKILKLQRELCHKVNYTVVDRKRIRKRIADNIRKLHVFRQIHILTKVDCKKVELEQKFVKSYCKEYCKDLRCFVRFYIFYRDDSKFCFFFFVILYYTSRTITK